MDYLKESFSFCSMFMVSFVGIIFYNSMNIFEFMIHGVGKGRVKISKRTAEVDTTIGNIVIPNVILPSLDWEVHLFETKGNEKIEDGINSLNVVSRVNTIECKVKGRTLLCEYIYPEELGSETIRGYISSIFDDECYVFTVKNGEMIDYRSFANKFMLQLEDL